MLTYTVEHIDSETSGVRKTLHVEGRAVMDQRLKLHAVLMDVLRSCDHLLVDINKVTDFDYSFVILICSMHRTAKLFRKKLTIQGTGTSSFSKACEHLGGIYSKSCLFNNGDNCSLSETGGQPVQEGCGRQAPGDEARERS